MNLKLKSQATGAWPQYMRGLRARMYKLCSLSRVYAVNMTLGGCTPWLHTHACDDVPTAVTLSLAERFAVAHAASVTKGGVSGPVMHPRAAPVCRAGKSPRAIPTGELISLLSKRRRAIRYLLSHLPR